MFDFSFTEMLLAGMVALIVLGPERLPKVARFIGEWVGKIQRLAAGVKSELSAQTQYADLIKIKNEVQQTAQEIQQDLREFEHQIHQESNALTEKIQSNIPAWERLPEQKSPADFGVDAYGQPLVDGGGLVDEHGFPIYSGSHQHSSSHEQTHHHAHGWQVKSLRKQSISRQRDQRPRNKIKPKLRMRK